MNGVMIKMLQYLGKSVWQCTSCKKVYVDRITTHTYCCGKLLMLQHSLTEQFKQSEGVI